MSTGQLARQRSSSSGTRPAVRSTTPVTLPASAFNIEFEPCAATASIFLFAQGSSILCLHHDTLAIERRFERHKEQVLLLSVDNVSERGAGRLVVSYDAGQTAVVWDLFTGDEIARFASYEHIRVAAWMKNGNLAFGKEALKFLGTAMLTCGRQFPRERHSFRTLDVGAYFSKDHLRPHHCHSASGRLPYLCDWVSQIGILAQRMLLNTAQVYEWVNLDCGFTTVLHYFTYLDDTPCSITHC